MNRIMNWVRPNIKELVAYSSARSEFDKGQAQQELVYLDANESPMDMQREGNGYNRYPDPQQTLLKRHLASKLHLNPQNLFIGNGSDEAIDLLYRIFCVPGKDKAMICSPTYGMYAVSAAINDVELIDVPLKKYVALDIKAMKTAIKEHQPKLLWLCSPNNPTGNLVAHDKQAPVRGLHSLIKDFPGMVVIDEAYIQFADVPSASTWLKKYDNLVVLQTLSKAYGLAGARVGIAMARPYVIDLFNKVKPPYNVNTLSQYAALEAVVSGFVGPHVERILEQRDMLTNALPQIQGIEKLYPTQANFILAQVQDARELYQYLIEQGVVVRDRSSHVPDTLRFTVGTEEENLDLLDQIITFYKVEEPEEDEYEYA